MGYYNTGFFAPVVDPSIERAREMGREAGKGFWKTPSAAIAWNCDITEKMRANTRFIQAFEQGFSEVRKVTVEECLSTGATWTLPALVLATGTMADELRPTLDGLVQAGKVERVKDYKDEVFRKVQA